MNSEKKTKKKFEIKENKFLVNFLSKFKLNKEFNMVIEFLNYDVSYIWKVILEWSNDTSQKEPKKFLINNPEEPIKKRKFEITEIRPPYRPEPDTIPSIKYSSHSNFDTTVINHHILYIQENAFKTIKKHIDWSSDTPRNTVEQGGLLLGKVLFDQAKKITCGIVQQAIRSDLAKGTSASLEVTHEAWKKMFDHVDTLLGDHDSKLHIIGWYHTHPNKLDVFMSGVDRATQSRLFSNDWQFAVVLNPHKKIWRVFYGSNSEECQGYIVEVDDDNKIENNEMKSDSHQ